MFGILLTSLVLSAGAQAALPAGRRARRVGADHCTAVAAGPKATVDGSALVGQTADAEGGPGISLVYVPAADHAPGTQRPVFDQEFALVNEKVQVGTIPQVPHTYAYSYGRYGLMNEHQLAFGESTCSGRLAAKSLVHNGTALFSNRELSMIALEQCKTARCAIQLMGKLAMDGGFYGESNDVDSGSETLMVADPTEAWVFHILADPTGLSAIWGAQKVPDDKIAFVPNTFIIREMNLSSSDFALSSNAIAIAKEFGWWDGASGTFDFAGAFSLGEYTHPYYSARRLWRAYDLLAPSLRLDPSQPITATSAGGYPFAVKPDKLLTTADIFRVYRDYYEGTRYSLVKNEIVAGPFNSPRRNAPGETEDKFKYAGWERPISIYRADHAYLNAVRPDGHGVVWIGPHVPHASVFSPAWTSASSTISRRYVIDTTQDVDRESLFWACSGISNWAHGSMFNLAIIDIRAKQVEWEAQSHALAASLKTGSPEVHNDLLLGFADKLHTAWWNVFWSLMFKYSDGYVVTRDEKGNPVPASPGYPEWYLKAGRFENALADANASSWECQAKTIQMAAEEYAKIDAKRVHPHAVAVVV